MIEDENKPDAVPVPPTCQHLQAANDNGIDGTLAIDALVLVIAGAIGRQIAREQLDQLQAANDNGTDDS